MPKRTGFFLVLLIISLGLTTGFGQISYGAEKVPFSYLLSVDQANWKDAFTFANYLLFSGFPVYSAATQKFVAGGVNFKAGDLVVPVSAPTIGWRVQNPEKTNQFAQSLAKKMNLKLVTADSPFRLKVHVLKPARVALLAQNQTSGGPYVHLRDLGFPTDLVTELDIKAGRLTLDNYDFFIIPGGASTPLSLLVLGQQGCKNIEDFVRSGGGYIGSCMAAYMVAYGEPASLRGWPEKAWLQLGNWKIWNVDYPGIGVVVVKNVSPTHPVMYGMPEFISLLEWQGPIMEAVPLALPERSDPVSLATWYDVTKDFTYAEYYYNLSGQKKASPEELARTTMGRGLKLRSPLALVAGYFGRGKVVSCGPHPEFALTQTREGYEYPFRIAVNALYWATQSDPVDLSIEQGFNELKDKATAGKTIVAELNAIPTDPLPKWLNPELWSSVGISPLEQWKLWMNKIPRFLDEWIAVSQNGADAVKNLQKQYEQLVYLESRLKALMNRGQPVQEEIAEVREAQGLLLQEIRGINEDLNFVYPVEWRPSRGVRQGAIFLLDRSIAEFESANKLLRMPDFKPPMDPRLYLMRSVGTQGAIGDLTFGEPQLRGRVTRANIAITEVQQKLADVSAVADAIEKLPTLPTASDMFNLVAVVTAIIVLTILSTGYITIRKSRKQA